MKSKKCLTFNKEFELKNEQALIWLNEYVIKNKNNYNILLNKLGEDEFFNKLHQFYISTNNEFSSEYEDYYDNEEENNYKIIDDRLDKYKLMPIEDENKQELINKIESKLNSLDSKYYNVYNLWKKVVAKICIDVKKHKLPKEIIYNIILSWSKKSKHYKEEKFIRDYFVNVLKMGNVQVFEKKIRYSL